MGAWRQYEAECAQKGTDPFDGLKDVVYGSPNGLPRWSKAIGEKVKAEAQQTITDLSAKLGGLNLIMDQGVIADLLATHRPVVFSGASKDSWEMIPLDKRVHIFSEMQKFLSELDPSKAIIVTGGTHFGFEACIHILAQKINATRAEENAIGLWVRGQSLARQSLVIRDRQRIHLRGVVRPKSHDSGRLDAHLGAILHDGVVDLLVVLRDQQRPF